MANDFSTIDASEGFFFWRIESCFPLKATEWGSQLYSLCVETKSPLNFFIIFRAKNVSAAAATPTWDDIWCCRLSDKQKSQPGHIVIFSFFFSKGAFEVLFFFFCFCCCHLGWLPPLLLLLLSSYLKLSAHTHRGLA